MCVCVCVLCVCVCVCIQLMLSEGIGALESATEFVHQAAVFSSNEDLEEVTTTDMKLEDNYVPSSLP